MRLRYKVIKNSNSAIKSPIFCSHFLAFFVFFAVSFLTFFLVTADSAFGMDSAGDGFVAKSYIVEIEVSDSADNLLDNTFPDNTFPDNNFPDNTFPDDVSQNDTFPDGASQNDTLPNTPDVEVSAGGVLGSGVSVSVLAVVLLISGGLAFVCSRVTIFVTEKHDSRESRRGVFLGFLLLLALPLVAFFTLVGPTLPASAVSPAQTPVLSLRIDKTASLSATGSIAIDGSALESHYVEITTALASAPAGIESSLADVALSKNPVVVSVIAAPTADGVYPFGFQASVADSLAPGTYRIVLETVVTDLRKPLTVSGVRVADKTYDGNTNATLAASGVLSGTITATDKVSLDISAVTATFADKDAAPNKEVTVSGYGLSGADAFKYVLSPPEKSTATIKPKPLVFTGALTARKPFDNTTAAPAVASLTITEPDSFSGLVGSERFELSSVGVKGITDLFSSPVAYYATESLGYSGAFSLTNATGGALAANYTFTQPAGIAAHIYDYIELTVQTDAPDQTVRLNKYFANAFDVNWGDGTDSQQLTTSTIHTYAAAKTYTVRLISRVDARYQAWAFAVYNIDPLVSKSWTDAVSVTVSFMPPMERFMTSANVAPDNFFCAFNREGALTKLPDGSFNTSSIATVGNHFFSRFNDNGALTELPAGSFNISSIATLGDSFFAGFNSSGSALTKLPDGSFRINGGITAVGDSFFASFNNGDSAITALPAGSFNTENITTVGNYFFANFNSSHVPMEPVGALTGLPVGSFNTSRITTVGNYFCYGFNFGGTLTSLPAGSFDLGGIKTVDSYFLAFFNFYGALDSLPLSFVFPRLGETEASLEYNFMYAFNSQTPLYLNGDEGQTLVSIINACEMPNSVRYTFVNQPGAMELREDYPNWVYIV
ncbi:MAG: YDG domain-containing protein [Propionibacteriaceae bacterium]|jgi:hypothetical protein|nr:YDG domain-containing protein [Propionibacteriaceae bacterium]